MDRKPCPKGRVKPPSADGGPRATPSYYDVTVAYHDAQQMLGADLAVAVERSRRS
jgi:hypothetical protein